MKLQSTLRALHNRNMLSRSVVVFNVQSNG